MKKQPKRFLVSAAMIAMVAALAVFFVVPAFASVLLQVDIKPGSDPNSINPTSGVIPVAILGTDSFDVTDVDLSTLAALMELRQPTGKVAI